MASASITARACALLAVVVCASACGDESTPPPAARKPVQRAAPGKADANAADAAPGPNDPRVRTDAAMREGDASIDGGGPDASMFDASMNDAASLPMMLQDGGDRAGTGGVGGVGGVGGTAGTSGIGGVGGEGGGAAVAGTFRP